MKVEKLTNEQLDHWVARAQGWEVEDAVWMPESVNIPAKDYTPTTNGQQCFDLIEKFQFDLRFIGDIELVWACGFGSHTGYADNPKVAVCRAVVASVFGDE